MKLTTEVALTFYAQLLDHFQLPNEALKNMNFTNEVAEKLTCKVGDYIESYDFKGGDSDKVTLTQAYLCIFAYVDSHSAAINPITDILEYATGFFSKKLTVANLLTLAEGVV